MIKKKNTQIKLMFILIVCITTTVFSQNNYRFWEDVQTIKNFDKIYKPLPNPIVFVGSSSIRMWSEAEQLFAKYNILNRGIGGAVVNDIIYYAEPLIFDYQPRQVVIYVGENDLGDGTTPADTIFKNTKKLFNTIRTKLPNVPIVYISIKPSPGRDHAKDILKQTNVLIREYIAHENNIKYIDVYKNMINKDGSYRFELFVNDKIHMTTEGYKIWKKAIKPHLLKKDK